MPVSQTASTAGARQLSGFAMIAALMMLFAAGKAVVYDTMDPDFFWHMRVAEQLQQEGIGPLVDHISFASVKKPWTPYSWLAELGMKWIWDHAGLRGAIAMQAILEAGFVLLIALCCLQRPQRNPSQPEPLMPIILATALAVMLAMPYLSFRPVLIAIDLLAVCAFLLLRDRRLGERTRLVWLVPAICAVLINLHIFAIFVPMWIAALLAGAWLEKDRRKLKRYAIMFALSILGCCCTPMLGGTISAIAQYMMSNPLTANSMIVELEPMYRGTGHQITLAIVSVVILCAAYRRLIRAGEWIWLLGMFVVFIKVGRAAPIFACVFAAAMSWSMPPLSDRVLGTRWVNFAAPIVLLIGAFRIGFSLPDNNHVEAWLNRRGDDLPGYPVAAAEYVQRNIHPTTGRLINEFDWGGFLAWKLPEFQVLLDGRTQLYTPEFWRQTYLDDPRETTQLLKTIIADAAILPAGKSRFRDSLHELGWKRAFVDPRAEVLVPPSNVAQTDRDP